MKQKIANYKKVTLNTLGTRKVTLDTYFLGRIWHIGSSTLVETKRKVYGTENNMCNVFSVLN